MGRQAAADLLANKADKHKNAPVGAEPPGR